jgi:FkbM family methyltransferase
MSRRRVRNVGRRHALDRVKQLVRLAEARLAWRKERVPFARQELRFVRSWWWHDASASGFAEEIGPYFSVLDDAQAYRTIIDAGAATGMFTVAAAVRYPEARIHAFEPSPRQRILLARNVRLNRFVPRVTVWPLGLWDAEGTLAFRTHGSMSSFAGVSMLPAGLPFGERARVTTLDQWAGAMTVDLIKMDIEGAELEALAGARGVLARDHPDVLVQAYHPRDGARTLERCAALLADLGYAPREVERHPGLLFATARHAASTPSAVRVQE